MKKTPPDDVINHIALRTKHFDFPSTAILPSDNAPLIVSGGIKK